MAENQQAPNAQLFAVNTPYSLAQSIVSALAKFQPGRDARETVAVAAMYLSEALISLNLAATAGDEAKARTALEECATAIATAPTMWNPAWGPLPWAKQS
jgi:hypothetical protein